MAYAAVVSLKNTIHHLLTSPRISIVSPSQKILESAYKDVQSLQEVLKRLDESKNCAERMKPIEEKIADAVSKLEDVLEFHESSQYLSQYSKSHGCLWKLSLDLKELRKDIDWFRQTAKKMEVDYVKELYKPLPEEEEEEEGDGSSSMYVGGNMVGLSDQFCEIRDKILEGAQFPYISIVGMAGIGKTAFAKKILKDPLIVDDFDCLVFVKVGQQYVVKKLLRAILAQVLNSESNGMLLLEGDEKLEENLNKSLIDKRYLIVLDDVWDADLWKMIRSFPNEYNGSWILVTTRLRQVAEFLSFFPYNMRLMNDHESWDLLREKVFAQRSCPSKLEKAGKKIAENCEGLPLLILAVGALLSKEEKTFEHWSKVAADKQNPTFMAAFDQISEVLYSSYEFLPQHLKTYFLYLGAFPQDYDTRCSKLIDLLSSEGFLEPYPYESLRISAKECLKELLASNLVMVRQWRSTIKRVKAYGLHIVFWNLCKRENGKNKFLHIFNSYSREYGLTQVMESKRRISIQKNILFSLKDVRDSMEYHSSTARSLLCTGKYHEYQVQLCFGFRLLRVLYALSIRFYEFPMEVLELVQLGYIALTCNTNLPHSISKLWNLQYLIIHQHSSIKLGASESCLPMEIWDLQELKFLQIMGRNLPNPIGSGAALPKLSTLLDVGALTCTNDILARIPILSKLRVQLELDPDFADEPLPLFDCISHLWNLKSVQCVVANPKFSCSGVVTPTLPFSDFTTHLKRLTLCGFGFPWIEMSKIAKLPFLRVLKLRCYAFRGEKWETKKVIYSKLEYLLIEDTDLAQWTSKSESFPVLKCLTMKNCYKLREIPLISSVDEIHLVDCNSSAVACADRAYYHKTYAYSSWL